MKEFLTLLPPSEALIKLLDRSLPLDEFEEIPTSGSLGRILAKEVEAPFSLPGFPKATVDGYALQATDSFGASDSLPAYLSLGGEVLMGEQPALSVQRGECALIHTGGMLPPGADAVIMLEFTQNTKPGEVEILRQVAAGENVLQIGEDILAGQVVIPAGVKIRPAEIGGLMALGVDRIQVRRRPKVAVISSGDELRHPGEALEPGQIYDINSFTLESLISTAGGEAKRYGIFPDDAEGLSATARKALRENDILVLTAGSSVSHRDLTASIIESLGAPGVLVHGVSIRPGKPTILGICGGKPAIGLPGNPVSALVIAGLFLVPLVEKLSGLAYARPRSACTARLAVNLASAAGREDWVPVRLVDTPEGSLAEPVFGKSNLIFTLVRADGLVRVPPEATGLAAGEQVQVNLMG